MPKRSKNPGMLFAFSITVPKPPAAWLPSTNTRTSAIIITIACMKSDALSARNPPKKVYKSTKTAPSIIMLIYEAPNRVENSLPQVTRQLEAYTAKKTSINRAEMVIMTFLSSLKRLLKKSGRVIALPLFSL